MILFIVCSRVATVQFKSKIETMRCYLSLFLINHIVLYQRSVYPFLDELRWYWTLYQGTCTCKLIDDSRYSSAISALISKFVWRSADTRLPVILSEVLLSALEGVEFIAKDRVNISHNPEKDSWYEPENKFNYNPSIQMEWFILDIVMDRGKPKIVFGFKVCLLIENATQKLFLSSDLQPLPEKIMFSIEDAVKVALKSDHSVKYNAYDDRCNGYCSLD